MFCQNAILRASIPLFYLFFLLFSFGGITRQQKILKDLVFLHDDFFYIYSLCPTQVVKTFLYEYSKNIIRVSLFSKKNDFSFTTLV